MTRQLLTALIISLSMTLVLELGYAIVFRKRGKDLLLVGLVNVMTNPAVVLIYYLVTNYTRLNPVVLTAALEVMAVLSEAYVYKTYGKNFGRPLLFSIGANIFSYGIGALILFVGG